MYKNVKNPYVYYYSNENLKEYNLISWAFYWIKFCIFFEVFRRHYSYRLNIIAELLQLSCLYDKRFLRFLSGWLKEKMLQAYFNKVLKEEIIPGVISAVTPAKQLQQQLQQNLPEPLKLLGQKAIQNLPAKKPISVSSRRKRYAYEITSYPWNNIPAAQLNNNCYNYANNKLTYTFAQPGRGSGAMCQYYFPDCMRNAAINDHLETLDLPPDAPLRLAPSGKKHLVALVINPGKKIALLLVHRV